MQNIFKDTDETLKMIVGDDHDTFIMYISILLKRMGFKVIPAHDGFEVIKLVKLFVPDAVLLDISMPKMDGIEALRYIKNDEQLYKIPVVMVSSILKKEVYDNCLKLGCTGYLTKPVKIEELNKTLQEGLSFAGGKKRRHLRTSLLEKIQIKHITLTKEYYALNLSSGGVYVRTKSPLPINSKVEVFLGLGESTLSLNGTVIYHKNLINSCQIDPGMAIRFEHCSSAECSLLEKYIKVKLAGDLIDEQEEKVLSMDGGMINN